MRSWSVHIFLGFGIRSASELAGGGETELTLPPPTSLGCSIVSYRKGDADIMNNIIGCMPALETLRLNVGTNLCVSLHFLLQLIR